MSKHTTVQRPVSHTDYLFSRVRSCSLCAAHLPLPPKPIIQGSSTSSILIIGQAPGISAHNSATPWNDPSGDRLRQWLGLEREQFYNEKQIAILPMGFCYPGRGKSGDLPPRKECAPLWHEALIDSMPIEVSMLIGQYAQDYYLKDGLKLTDRIKYWQDYLPNHFLLPHPSPRNNIWLKQNPWFEQDVIPYMREQMQKHFT